MELSALQLAQAEFDAEFWPHQPGFDTIQHSFWHLQISLGKLAEYLETNPTESSTSKHQLVSEVIPDLLSFAARLANNEDLELGTLFIVRTEELKKRFSKTQPDEGE